MSAWWLIAPGALGCLVVLVTAAKLSAPKPRHAAPRGLPGPEASATFLPAPPVGSMSLLDELAAQKHQRVHEKIMRDLAEGPPGDGTFAFTIDWPYPADPVPFEDLQSDARIEDGPDWREQTAADLSPEILGADPHSCHPWPDSGLEVMPDASAIAMHLPGVQGSTAPVSPGPGERGSSSSTAPGPDSGTAMVAGEIPARPLGGHETAVPHPVWADRNAGRFDSVLDGPVHGHSLSGETGPSTLAPTRLADTGDIRDARLLADVQAYLRAQDDDARAYCSALELGRRDYMHQLRLNLTEAPI